MRVHDSEHPPEHLGGDGVHLIQHHEAPLLRLQPLHGLLGLPRAPLPVRDHRSSFFFKLKDSARNTDAHYAMPYTPITQQPIAGSGTSSRVIQLQ
ncbi:unnamed protein product [Leptidea sinapis]|uniref:Uncharacterized protein n=1 Tax=Leptidea sinapis TaxID=189913 RepID=A0A5E4PLY4_9NEOP|nr:unnamed protein product [Leptidea sinapis]